MADTVRWLTTEDVAERACCSATTIRRAIRQGRLQAVRVRGRDFRFLERWIDEWLMNKVLPDECDVDIAINITAVRSADSRWSFEMSHDAEV